MMDTDKKTTCKAVGTEYVICNTASSLMPLYHTDLDDQPDTVLGSFPNPVRIANALQVFIDIMFPGKSASAPLDPHDLGVFLFRRLSEGWRLLRPEIEKAIPFRWIGRAAITEGAPEAINAHDESFTIIKSFMDRLPDIRALLVEDVRAAYEGDPAALTFAEVQLSYPGLLAIASHRLAHEFYKLNVPIVPRVMSEWTHAQTGVDINPGATIGHGFFIDHATGVVIGETAEIGDRVKIYQGVTLGAKSFPKDEQGNPIKHIKRHPTVEDEVVIYANATILGGKTVIGKKSIIGGNVFIMESIPPHSVVTSIQPELHIKQSREMRDDDPTLGYYQI